ncbi:MAG: AAA-like domain-containing protein [Armatimonadota bacterium]|nr:AAA-like domain-containing protein [Armatimonadota bacterium]
MDSQSPFFRPGGTLEPGAESYIPRAADEQLLAALLMGEYVFLLDSRQKGKSSLVARTLLDLKDHGVSTVKLDLQRIGSNVSPEQWYAGLLSGIGQELSVSKELFDFWEKNQTLGPLARWLLAIEKVVLPLREGPIVIFIDEVDFVRALPFTTDEFFAGIRECFNRRALDSSFRRLTFCLVGVATPGQLIRSPEISPFNIGTQINLLDFTLGETLVYGKVLGASGRSGAQLLARVHHWVGGHPYLTQLVCSHLVKDPAIDSAPAVDRLVSTLFFSAEARQREPNLSDVERRLLEPDVHGLTSEERRTQVLGLYGRMLKRNRVNASEENPIVDTLRLSGVGTDESGWLGVRNRVYRKVFDEAWRKSNLPDAEVRRLHGAARKAVVYTGLVASVVLLGVSSTALGMWRLSTDRKGALETLGHRTKELDRVSNERQRSLIALQQRTQDLKRASDEKQRSLNALETRTAELNRVSNERKRSLIDLKKRSAELAIVSGERQDAILGLERRTRDLTYSNYLGQVGRALQYLSQQRWTKLPALVHETEANPHRNWEWGNLALAVNYGTREQRFPKWTILENRPGSNPGVFAPDGIYSINEAPARRTLAFKSRMTVIPRFLKGNYRVKVVEGTRGDAIFDATTDKLLVPNRIYSQIMDIDAQRGLFLLARDATLEILELRSIADDRLIVAYTGPDHVHAAQFLPDGTVISAHQSSKPNVGEIRHWDKTGRTISSSPTDQQFAHGVTISRDGLLYSAWGSNGKIEIRAVEGHRQISALAEFPNVMSDVKFSDDGTRVLVGCDDGYVYLHDLRKGNRLAKLSGHRSRVGSVAFLKSAKGFASVDSQGYLRIWNEFPQPGWQAFVEPNRRVTHGAIASDGKTLLTVLDDAELLSRDLGTEKVRRQPIPDAKSVALLALSGGGDDLFIVRANGQVQKMSGMDNKTVSSEAAFSTKPSTLEVLPGGKRLLVGYEGHKFSLLDTKTLQIIKRIAPERLRVAEEATGVDITDAFAFDQKSAQIAMFLGTVGKIQIYSAIDGKLITQWSPGRSVRCMTFVNDGKQLVSSLGSAWWVRDGQAILFDAGTGKRIHEFKHHGQTISDLKYASRTGVLAGKTGDRDYFDRVVYLWDLRTRKRIGELGTTAVEFFFFSPDGERIVTRAGGNFAARLWDSRTGEEMFRLTEAGEARFSADGRRIIQFPPDGSVRVWNSAPWK